MEVLIELEREKDNSFIERETERERETEPKAKMAQLLTNSIFHLGVKDNKTVATKRTPPPTLCRQPSHEQVQKQH